MDPLTNGANALQPQTAAPIATAISTIDLPLLANPQDALLATKENFITGERVSFEKIKMPSGGGLSFTLADEDGKQKPVAELKGIILAFKPFKSWYEKSFNDKNPDDDLFPDCYSADCITGSGCPSANIPAGQKCETCPKGQWGSARNGGKGKDCGDRMGLWILLDGYALPVFFPLPKTSLGNFKDYRKRLASKAKVFYGVVTSISLVIDKSSTGVEFSKANFARAADLTPQERAIVKQYIDEVSGSFQVSREAITVDDSAHEDTGGGTDINKMDFSNNKEQLY